MTFNHDRTFQKGGASAFLGRIFVSDGHHPPLGNAHSADAILKAQAASAAFLLTNADIMEHDEDESRVYPKVTKQDVPILPCGCKAVPLLDSHCHCLVTGLNVGADKDTCRR